jgi:phytoene dehydrogenase-like protein
MSGAKVCVLERRHIVGGAAVTEEIVPGFKFSRASYVLSLLRPQIIKDLELKVRVCRDLHNFALTYFFSKK